jgi:hypothetical protein
MSFSLSAARATITKLTLDKKPGDDGAKEVSTALKVEVKTSADILAEFHPSLRAALFVRDAGVRFRSMKEIGWEGTRRGIDLAIRPGPDIKPAVKLTDVTLRDFKLKPIEEGSQQLIGIKFTVDVDEAPVARILEYLKEESWIDLHGGGELDLAPPSAKETIEGMEEPAPAPPVSAGRPNAGTPPETDEARAALAAIEVNQVRRLQPTLKGAKAKLANYPNAVLKAAIAAEMAAANCRPMFIQMLEAEIERRNRETSQ